MWHNKTRKIDTARPDNGFQVEIKKFVRPDVMLKDTLGAFIQEIRAKHQPMKADLIIRRLFYQKVLNVSVTNRQEFVGIKIHHPVLVFSTSLLHSLKHSHVLSNVLFASFYNDIHRHVWGFHRNYWFMICNVNCGKAQFFMMNSPLYKMFFITSIAK